MDVENNCKLIFSVEPIRFPLTGIGRYSLELAMRLKHTFATGDIKFMDRYTLMDDFALPRESYTTEHSVKQLVQKNYLMTECYRLLSGYKKASILKNYQDFLYHGPNFLLPKFEGRKVATFHDLSAFKFPECNTKSRIKYMQKEFTKTILSAHRLITDSNYVKQEIHDYFGYPIDKIDAIALAATQDFYPRSAEQCNSILKTYNLSFGSYTLFVGTIEPRKNIATLLKSYELLPLKLRQKNPLVLVGHKGWLSENIHQQIDKLSSQGWVKYLDFVAEADLPILYAGAKLFCFPSLYEGFGLPLLEAMQSGIPIVCSNTSSIPEVVNKTALMCDPYDEMALYQNLHKGLEDNLWSSDAREDGLQYAKNFSWDKCFIETMKVYQKVVV